MDRCGKTEAHGVNSNSVRCKGRVWNKNAARAHGKLLEPVGQRELPTEMITNDHY